MLKKSIEASETSLKDFAMKDEGFKSRFVELIDPSSVVPENLEEWVKEGSAVEEELLNNPDSIKAI